jgi:diguanylate cyclase (GGDEF)-like protein
VPIVLVIFVGLLTLFRCKSEKKNYFLLGMVSILFILTGHLLELVSNNTDEAFTAIRVLYIGSGFVSPFILFFIADYCDIRINRFIKALVVLIAFAFIYGAWTTDATHLVYNEYWYDDVTTHYLLYTPGKLNLLYRVYPVLFALVPVGIIVGKLRKNHGRYKMSLIILLISIMLPYIGEILYYLATIKGTFTFHVYLTPHMLAIMAVLLYIGIMKYDMFDATPVAAVMAMETISEAFLLLDHDLGCLSSNSSAKLLFPWLPDLPKGESIYTVADWPAELSPAVFISGEYQVDYEREYDNRTLYYRASIKSTLQRRFGSPREFWSVLIRDVTESEIFLKRLEEAAYTDTLTGLYNRRHFAEIAAPFVERARRSNTPYYVMISDLDLFKNVNDEHGHLAGDEVLRNVARIMKNTIRSYDILARWGGEEFIMLITDPDEGNVLRLAERVRINIENGVCEYMGQQLKISISSGVAQSGSDDDLTEIVRRADEALYTSKQTGRNKVTLWKE